ncbi:MAG: ATP-binding cassette domain-containing protein, partial [Anaerolineae bacterium]|nr:ATP-binding cassette domain-containing protein [Anaerolineae bacterium]
MQPDETPIAVACRGVTKIYPAGRQSARVVAVDNLDLEIRHGEFFTLLGPSGCGKTTTLRMIAGFEQPTSGEIFIDGQPMSQVGPEKRPVNTVFQNYALFPHLNVGDNVGFGLKVKRVPAAERARRVTEALALVRLPGLEGRRATQ